MKNPFDSTRKYFKAVAELPIFDYKYIGKPLLKIAENLLHFFEILFFSRHYRRSFLFFFLKSPFTATKSSALRPFLSSPVAVVKIVPSVPTLTRFYSTRYASSRLRFLSSAKNIIYSLTATVFQGTAPAERFIARRGQFPFFIFRLI